MADDTYSAEQLEQILGVKPRNVHYWVQEGLLEGPGAGRGARYTDEHLAKLFLIQKLRDEGVSLSEIRKAIERLRGADIQTLAVQARTRMPRPPTRAKELITQWLADASASQVSEPSPIMRRAASPRAPVGSVLGLSGGSDSWRRMQLAPGLELHVREPLLPSSQHLLEALLALADRLRSKEKP